jgi:hypothetical protein
MAPLKPPPLYSPEIFGRVEWCVGAMKRVAVWIFYGVGALAIAYLALYAYAAFTGRELQPGDPIHIFRKPDAPSYSRNREEFIAGRGGLAPGHPTASYQNGGEMSG